MLDQKLPLTCSASSWSSICGDMSSRLLFAEPASTSTWLKNSEILRRFNWFFLLQFRDCSYCPTISMPRYWILKSSNTLVSMWLFSAVSLCFWYLLYHFVSPCRSISSITHEMLSRIKITWYYLVILGYTYIGTLWYRHFLSQCSWRMVWMVKKCKANPFAEKQPWKRAHSELRKEPQYDGSGQLPLHPFYGQLNPHLI